MAQSCAQNSEQLMLHSKEQQVGLHWHADGVAMWQPMLRAERESEATPHQRLHDVPTLWAVGCPAWRTFLGRPGYPAGLGTVARRPHMHVPAARHGAWLCKGGLSTCEKMGTVFPRGCSALGAGPPESSRMLKEILCCR